MEILLIRHGKTKGNIVGRYIGTTDEPLCEEGREILKKHKYPKAELIFVSPLLRCLETKDILYPDIKHQMIYDLRECDFGEFENKNYKELSDNLNYQKWIDSNGTMAFPGGESREQFQVRCVDAFVEGINIARKEGREKIAFIIHGGTIMSILDTLVHPKIGYYHWKVNNGEGYILSIDMKKWNNGNRVLDGTNLLYLNFT